MPSIENEDSKAEKKDNKHSIHTWQEGFIYNPETFIYISVIFLPLNVL